MSKNKQISVGFCCWSVGVNPSLPLCKCRSKNTNFNRLLIFLSVADILLIVFFLLMSSSTVLSDPPQWFVVLFPYLLW